MATWVAVSKQLDVFIETSHKCDLREIAKGRKGGPKSKRALLFPPLPPQGVCGARCEGKGIVLNVHCLENQAHEIKEWPVNLAFGFCPGFVGKRGLYAP